MKVDIRGDDGEPIYQHQVDRDRMMEGSKAGWRVCSDPKCGVKIQPHSHRVQKAGGGVAIDKTETADNTTQAGSQDARTKVDGLHRYKDSVSGEIKVLPPEFMPAHREFGCGPYCLGGDRPETGSQSQSQGVDKLLNIELLAVGYGFKCAEIGWDLERTQREFREIIRRGREHEK